MATVEHQQKLDSERQPFGPLADLVVAEEGVGVVEVHVGQAEDFVLAIGFVAVVVGHIRSVAREVEQEPVTGLGVFVKPVHLGEDVLVVGLLVGQAEDVFFGEVEIAGEQLRLEGNVVEAALEFVVVVVVVDPDEECFIRHGCFTSG